jgi:hypothetical protein
MIEDGEITCTIYFLGCDKTFVEEHILGVVRSALRLPNMSLNSTRYCKNFTQQKSTIFCNTFLGKSNWKAPP